MSDKHRIELQNRRRKADETLQSVHSDIRRLAALAYPGVPPEMREEVTCDHFLDVLGDPDLVLKIRERHPADLDSALKVALQLEVWAKESTRHQDASKSGKDGRRVREISAKQADSTVEALQKEVENMKKFVGYEHRATKNPNGGGYVGNYWQPAATRYTALSACSGAPSTPLSSRGPHTASYGNRSNSARPPNGNRNGNFYQAPNSNFGCFNCGNPTHRVRDCPVPSAEHRRPEQQSIPPPQPSTPPQPDVRPMKNRSNKQEKTCIWVKYRQHKLSALIDTRSDVSIVSEDIARNLGWTIHAHQTKEVSVANNKTMSILGATRVVLDVAGHDVESEILIAPDLDGLILGIDWLRSQGRVRWDFDRGKIKFGKRNWIELQQETEQPCRTSIIRKDFFMANHRSGFDGSDFHAAPTGPARRFCRSTLGRKFLREVSLFCHAMHQVESGRERGKASGPGAIQCVSSIRRRMCDDVFANLSQYPPRLSNLWALYDCSKCEEDPLDLAPFPSEFEWNDIDRRRHQNKERLG